MFTRHHAKYIQRFRSAIWIFFFFFFFNRRIVGERENGEGERERGGKKKGKKREVCEVRLFFRE